MPIFSPQQYKYDFSDQKGHDDFVKKMAKIPGRHSGNIIRQDLSNVFLHYLAWAGSESGSITVGSSRERPPVINPTLRDLTYTAPCPSLKLTSWQAGHSDIQNVRPSTNNGLCLNQLEREVCQAFDNLTLLQTAKLSTGKPYARIIPPDAGLAAPAQTSANGIPTLLDEIKGITRSIGAFVAYYEPLQLQRVEALSYSPEKRAGNRLKKGKINDAINIKDVDSGKLNDSSENKSGLHKIVSVGRGVMNDFFDLYQKNHPNLKELARGILKEKIAQRFHLNLDPDRTYFMQFDVSMYEGNRLLQYGPPIAKKTLTEYLFTNFGSDVQDYLVNVDAVSGIYDTSQQNVRIHDVADAIKIKPTDFIKLVWDIDFYNYAKVKLTGYFSHPDDHIKNHFFSFINHLDTSQIDSDAAKDVLNGVGLLKNNHVSVTLFDINQYRAADAFAFRNRENKRVTLYFPKSDFKLISFRGDFEMRTWVTNACATEEHRKMLASHFTLANRQDGLFYYGVDAWLNSINLDNGYSDRIAISSVEFPSEHFFAELFYSVKAKTFSDLDSQIKSDAEVRRDMWEDMIDVSNIIPNPVSPFLSLAIHIEHAINADNYREKMQEWSKLKNDAVNLITLVVLDKAIKLSDTGGYEFIDAVAHELASEEPIGINNMMQEDDELPPGSCTIFNPASPQWAWAFDKEDVFSPESPSWDWLMEKNSAPERLHMEHDEIPVVLPLPDEQIKTRFAETIPRQKKFLPLRTLRYLYNTEQLDDFIYKYIYKQLKSHPYDIFYGFDESKSDVPAHIKNARIKTKIALKSAKDLITKVHEKIINVAYEKEIKDYLSIALQTKGKKILKEALTRLKMQVLRAHEFLNEAENNNYPNIGFISTKALNNLDNQLPFMSRIDDIDYLKKLTLGFTCKKDPYRRIFIMLDSIQTNSLEDKSICKLNSLFLHEVSHISSDTMDFCYNTEYDKYNDPGNPRSILRRFNVNIDSGEFINNDEFNFFMRINYRKFGIDTPYDPQIALELIKNDPMLRANLLMNNADNFVSYVKHISSSGEKAKPKRHTEQPDNKDIMKILGLVFSATRDHFLKNY